MNYTEWFAKNKFSSEEMWFKSNLVLETIVGSYSYGCENENSDYDVWAIVMPRPEHLWPQKYGYILHYDELPSFRRKQLKGKDRTKIESKDVEIEWISLVEFFKLAGLECSPNVMEMLFVRRNLVTYSSKVGWTLRDNRHLFLSAKTFHTFKHYANKQMQTIRSKQPVSLERKAIIEQYGFDIKMAYHVLRLLDETEQILTTHDIDLTRNNQECKLMKKGLWGSFESLEKLYRDKMIQLESLALKADLSPLPQAESLHKLLNDLMDEYYGEADLRKTTDFVSASDVMNELTNIKKLLEVKNATHFVSDKSDNSGGR